MKRKIRHWFNDYVNSFIFWVYNNVSKSLEKQENAIARDKAKFNFFYNNLRNREISDVRFAMQFRGLKIKIPYSRDCFVNVRRALDNSVSIVFLSVSVGSC